MSRRPTWREVADTLAARMVHHAYCRIHGREELDADCPFCEDQAAYMMWRAMSDSAKKPSPDKGFSPPAPTSGEGETS